MTHYRNVFDIESPFLKHMRISLQIWLRVIIDDPILMKCPELIAFIQFRWVYAHTYDADDNSLRFAEYEIVSGLHYSSDHSFGFESKEKNDQSLKPSLQDFTLLKVEFLIILFFYIYYFLFICIRRLWAKVHLVKFYKYAN